MFAVCCSAHRFSADVLTTDFVSNRIPFCDPSAMISQVTRSAFDLRRRRKAGRTSDLCVLHVQPSLELGHSSVPPSLSS
uniref:Uncharacterized protein n=1 Tax=Anguilla anguilla TaxID=7936 RepID=A0A0E9U6K9_ANGAN